MIHELRTYTFHPGKLPEYMKLAETVGRPVRGNDYGVNRGYWTTEFGTLNQVWHLWEYESLDERARLRVELGKNQRWTSEYVPNIRPLLARQEIRFLNPVKPVVTPEATGGIYELRMYRTKVGAAGPWTQLYMGIMPVREKYSRNVGLWTGEAPQPNEALHMWNYSSVEARIKTRAALFQDPEWQGFVAKGGAMLEEMHSIMLLPTPYSPMQ